MTPGDTSRTASSLCPQASQALLYTPPACSQPHFQEEKLIAFWTKDWSKILKLFFTEENIIVHMKWKHQGGNSSCMNFNHVSEGRFSVFLWHYQCTVGGNFFYRMKLSGVTFTSVILSLYQNSLNRTWEILPSTFKGSLKEENEFLIEFIHWLFHWIFHWIYSILHQVPRCPKNQGNSFRSSKVLHQTQFKVFKGPTPDPEKLRIWMLLFVVN